MLSPPACPLLKQELFECAQTLVETNSIALCLYQEAHMEEPASRDIEHVAGSQAPWQDIGAERPFTGLSIQASPLV